MYLGIEFTLTVKDRTQLSSDIIVVDDAYFQSNFSFLFFFYLITIFSLFLVFCSLTVMISASFSLILLKTLIIYVLDLLILTSVFLYIFVIFSTYSFFFAELQVIFTGLLSSMSNIAIEFLILMILFFLFFFIKYFSFSYAFFLLLRF